jgi:hypothetical protein
MSEENTIAAEGAEITAESLGKVAAAIEKLGSVGAGSQAMGAIEEMGVNIQNGLFAVRDGSVEIADAIRELAEAIRETKKEAA